jgi:hypothetical protein
MAMSGTAAGWSAQGKKKKKPDVPSSVGCKGPYFGGGGGGLGVPVVS